MCIANANRFRYHIPMNIRQCSDKASWNQWYGKQDHAEFLQSWEWGDFQMQTGKEVVRIQLEEDAVVVDQIQAFVHDLGLGVRYLYVPRYAGTGTGWSEKNGFLAYCRQHKYAFVRVEPLHALSGAFDVRYVSPRQPQHEWNLSLEASLDVIRAAMHPKTRYNIHLAEKKGVSVEQKKDIDIFWNLTIQTGERDTFRTHEKKYYESMLENEFLDQYTAYYQQQPIATILCISFGDTYTYVHGASSNASRNVMAPYVLQWNAIQVAKANGLGYYSLGGVAAQSVGPTTSFHGYTWDADHRFTGITRFKVGFGGHLRTYAKATDIVLRPFQYALYRTAHSFWRRIR